jgi:hypothetical protein
MRFDLFVSKQALFEEKKGQSFKTALDIQVSGKVIFFGG